MKNFLKLFEQIHKNKNNLKLEPLNIEFKDVSTLTLTALLYPILKGNYQEEVICDYSKNNLLKIDSLYNEILDNNLVRVGIIGEDANNLFLMVKEKLSLYKSKDFPIINNKDEVYFTINNKYYSEFEKNAFNYDVTIITMSHGGFYKNNFLEKASINTDEIKELMDDIYLSKSAISVNLLFSIVGSLGININEFILYLEIRTFDQKLVLDFIENINTPFVSTLFKNLFDRLIGPYYLIREAVVKVEKTRKILKKYSLDLLVNYTCEEAIGLFYGK